MCDYFPICLHCAVVIALSLRMGNEVSMVLLSPVQSAVSQTDTHQRIQSPFISLGRTLCPL